MKLLQNHYQKLLKTKQVVRLQRKNWIIFIASIAKGSRTFCVEFDIKNPLAYFDYWYNKITREAKKCSENEYRMHTSEMEIGLFSVKDGKIIFFKNKDHEYYNIYGPAWMKLIYGLTEQTYYPDKNFMQFIYGNNHLVISFDLVTPITYEEWCKNPIVNGRIISKTIREVLDE